jgi:Kef-type K+ transport system membrane component KefB
MIRTVKTEQIYSLLLALAVISLLAYLFGAAARRLGQPAVIGEIVLGVLLGPTVLSGVLSDTLFPVTIRPFLSALADVGIALFMFTVGLDFDRRLIRGRRMVASTVACGSILLPFALGVALAFYLLRGHPSNNHTAFVLFMGAAMSVTAFPVLARILTDRGLARTWLGSVALACAAIDDVLAWTLLAGVVAISGNAAGSEWLLLLAVPYMLILVLVVRPALRRLLAKRPAGGPGGTLPIVVTLAGLLMSAAFTEWIGLHFIFGAFLFGAVMPRDAKATVMPHDDKTAVTESGAIADTVTAADGGPATALATRIREFNGVLLLPIFFIVAGLNVDLSHLDASGIIDLVLILLVAVGGKFGGAFAGARLNRMRSRPAAALAVLMNTRGLTELIILTVGLQLGVLDRDLYSYMVVMALVTTMMAGPLLSWIYPTAKAQAEDLAREQARDTGLTPVGGGGAPSRSDR